MMSMVVSHSVIDADAGHRFSTSVVGLAEIWATGVRRKRRKRIARERGVSPTALYGRSAPRLRATLCLALRGVQEAVRFSTMRRTEDCTKSPSFNEVFAQGAHPGGSEGGARGAQTQLLVEHVGCGGQKITQLIGEEAAAPVQSLLDLDSGCP
jgi:hypothetical protein